MDIMNQPPLKLYDKGYSCFSQRITTIKEQLGADIDIETVVESIENSFERQFHTSLEIDKPDTWEEKAINDFIDNRYSNHAWIFPTNIHGQKCARESSKRLAAYWKYIYPLRAVLLRIL